MVLRQEVMFMVKFPEIPWLSWASWTSPKTHFSAPSHWISKALFDWNHPGSGVATERQATDIPWLHGCFLYAKWWNVCWQVGDLWLGHSFFVNIRCRDSSGHFLGSKCQADGPTTLVDRRLDFISSRPHRHQTWNPLQSLLTHMKYYEISTHRTRNHGFVGDDISYWNPENIGCV